MSIRTILVHLANDDHHAARLDVAIRMARRHKAHLLALFLTTPTSMPPGITGRGASSAYLAEATQVAREKAASLEKEFEDTCSAEGISHTWVVEEGSHLDILAAHAHVADIAIVSQYVHDSFEDHFRLRMAEELVLVAGCPVLVLPRVPVVPEFGRHMLVAWRSNREAVRAVRDNLDLLRAAEKVTVLSIGGEPEAGLPSSEVVQFLARHGIDAEARIDVDEADNVGKILLQQAENIGADSIIMGAYSHSRLREVILGGTTRHVFEHTDIPVIMSH